MKYFTLILTICCLAACCATPHSVPVAEKIMTNEDEQILWRRALVEQEKINDSGLLYQDAEIENYLNQIAKKLQINTISPDIPFQIKVVKDPNLNAFAFPNGVIYVHTGILARMDNEAQLAALLAHEMTHCTHRHSLRVLRGIKDRPPHIAALQHALSKINMLEGLAQLFGLNGSMAAVMGYTREFETEADRIGLDLTAKSNYDPRETLKLFRHLQQEIEVEGINESLFLGTHPNVQPRIENVNNWLDTEYQGENQGIKNTVIFQSKMQRLVLDNARLDLRLGRFYPAHKTVRKYLDINPNDAKAYYLLGEILRQRDRQNDWKAAKTYYRKAISLDPAFVAPHKAMGLIHYKEGEKRQAQQFFESCLLLAPNGPDKAYIQGYLKKCINDGEKS